MKSMVTVTQGTPSSSYWSIVVAEKQRLLAWSEDKKKKKVMQVVFRALNELQRSTGVASWA